jgi:putative transposase
MPRLARVVIEDIPYHITQRGNRREKVFFATQDYQQYLDWLKGYARESSLEIYTYCLMPNHIHMIVVPHKQDALVKVFKPLHMRYAQLINRRRGWKGHLWQGRYFSAPLDDAYLWSAVRYVEQNPVRAGMINEAQEYEWSGAAGHCHLKEDPLLSDKLPLKEAIDDWVGWLKEKEDSKKIEIIRRNTEKGLPCGSNRFIKKLEQLVKRFLGYRPQGRPRKEGVLVK